MASQLSSGSFLSSDTASPKIILFNGSSLFLFSEDTVKKSFAHKTGLFGITSMTIPWIFTSLSFLMIIGLYAVFAGCNLICDRSL